MLLLKRLRWLTTLVQPVISTSPVVTRDAAPCTRRTPETFFFFKPRPLQELLLDATGSDNPEKKRVHAGRQKPRQRLKPRVLARLLPCGPAATPPTPPPTPTLSAPVTGDPVLCGVRRGSLVTMFSSWSCSEPTCRGEHTGEVRTSRPPVIIRIVSVL